tara:strand:- start:16760 stop:17836 length:1077 start_codon:yes stop_codon:yes gene_type:complete
LKIIYLIILIFTISHASEKYETKKTSCILQSNYSNKPIEELKKILIEQAKRESIEELYGSLLSSKTIVKNGKLFSDEIKQKAVGAVRIEGNPAFYNGKNFGEICAEINSYITKKDLEKHSPKSVKLNNFCFNDTSVATKDIKQKAKEKAYREVITKYKPSLKNISFEDAEQYIHEFSITNENFDFNKGSLCFDASASILPYELELSNQNNFIIDNASELENGIKVTFFEKNDRYLKNPILTTFVTNRSFYLKNYKFPLNKKLNSSTIYQVRLEGFIKPLKDISDIMIKHDVYNFNLKIENKEVLNKKRLSNSINLKENKLYRFNLLVKSSNAYDIAFLVKKTNGSIFKPLTSEEIYYK